MFFFNPGDDIIDVLVYRNLELFRPVTDWLVCDCVLYIFSDCASRLNVMVLSVDIVSFFVTP